MNNEQLKRLEDEIYSWYWARNGPSPALADALMQRFITRAEPRACTKDGADLKRGQYRFVAKELGNLMHIDTQPLRTLLSVLSNHKLIIKQHQSNKRATIITVCNYNSYMTCKNKSNNKPTSIQHQSNKNLTNYKGTHDNIIINNNDKVNYEAKKYYLDSQQRGGAPARVHRRSSGGEAPIYGEIAEIANDRSWLEVLAMNYHKTIESIMPMFGMFRTECLASGKTRHDSIADCKSHFNNWLRIQLQRKADDGKRKNEYPTREEQTETSLEALRMLDEVQHT